MLSIEITKNLSGFSIWGTTNMLINLRELIITLLEDNLFFKHQNLINELYSVPYEIRKAYEGKRHNETFLDFQDNTYTLYGFKYILPFFLIHTALIRESMKFHENSKLDLSILYLLEFHIENNLHKIFTKDYKEIIETLSLISSLDHNEIYEKLPSRCTFYLSLKTKKEKIKYLLPILKSFLPPYEKMELRFNSNEYTDNFEW